jgi:hypothetical protein
MAVNFSLNSSRLDRETRKASRNPRATTNQWASQQYYELEASRESVLPWAAPRTQTFRIRATDRAKLTKELTRNGWKVRARKLKKNTNPYW